MTPITQIHAIEPMTIAEFREDKRLINEYHQSQQLIKSVELNTQEFIQAIVKYAVDFLETSEMEEGTSNEVSLNFSRLFLNILSMFRAFLDHSDVSVSKQFGKDSEQYKFWKKCQSEQFDTVFEYRFFYRLRNYCQHVGMPPMHTSFSESSEQEGISFKLDFSKKILLEDEFSWGKRLLKDFELMQEKISVLNCLENWRSSFLCVAKELRKIKRDAALKAAIRMASHRKRLNLPEISGKLCAAKIPTREKKLLSLNMRLDWFPERLAREIIFGTAIAPTYEHQESMD